MISLTDCIVWNNAEILTASIGHSATMGWDGNSCSYCDDFVHTDHYLLVSEVKCRMERKYWTSNYPFFSRINDRLMRRQDEKVSWKRGRRREEGKREIPPYKKIISN